MKALIAMSGGVDSSVAAKLTVDAGYECIGCNMRLYDEFGADVKVPENSCCSLEDVEDARSVARKLGMDFYAFNFKEGFREKIIDKFVACYERGETPNPCVDCNRYMKFDALFHRGQELGCDKIVTGHYVRVEEKDGVFYLKKALDPGKDQSYVLYALTQEQLSHCLFPLGELEKTRTRQIAEETGFVNFDKPDSQDICFVPNGDYASVIEQVSGKSYEPGDFVDPEGNVLGRHKGIIHYTIGQRKGLGLSLKEPMYVCKLDVPGNRVILGRNEDLFKCDVLVRDVNWTLGSERMPAVGESFRCKAKVRYRQEEQWCDCRILGADEVREMKATGSELAEGVGDVKAAGCELAEGIGNAKVAGSELDSGIWVALHFDEAQRAITPGQAAVLYDGEIVLGGGTIVR